MKMAFFLSFFFLESRKVWNHSFFLSFFLSQFFSRNQVNLESDIMSQRFGANFAPFFVSTTTSTHSLDNFFSRYSKLFSSPPTGSVSPKKLDRFWIRRNIFERMRETKFSLYPYHLLGLWVFMRGFALYWVLWGVGLNPIKTYSFSAMLFCNTYRCLHY